jgi:hypothetical protein
VPLVDTADFSREHEADRASCYRLCRQQGRDVFVSEAEESGFCRFKVFFQPLEPARMGEITRADYLDALGSGPGEKPRRRAFFARGTGKGGVDVQIGDIVQMAACSVALKKFPSLAAGHAGVVTLHVRQAPVQRSVNLLPILPEFPVENYLAGKRGESLW